ncbi:Na(+)/H(+) antiporter subunit F1 [Aureibacillus halotolerans]|uniref:Multisubunit sodium/proton antiporter MrpF subunit n=1 Tax=Aureibacillus halotolerans TaxID=1508390 RepID=A0A4R6U044_9BACI|nr:Na(+)/H(+) antiporter subunit F1 [Aureibacillus halotolerans]TDQ38023.1 multisubunit sodium/proton antiporter MrpF subunit [Aureibacillus halotolerans]
MMMDGSILPVAITISMGIVSVSLLMLFIRVVIGPTMPDRAAALDAIGINLIAMIGLLAIRMQTIHFNDVILLIAIITFIGTVALAKFLVSGSVIDREMDNSNKPREERRNSDE